MGTRTQTRALPGRIPSEAIDGATARVLAPAGFKAPPKRRTPLSVVPAAVRSRKAPGAVLCFAVLLAALAAVLVLNISVSKGQYEVVGLRAEERALVQENEALQQHVRNLESPQNLAAEAADLGMVVPGSVAAIDLESLTIQGTSTPAQKEKAPSSLVDVPGEPDAGSSPKLETPGTAASSEAEPAPASEAEDAPEAASGTPVEDAKDAKDPKDKKTTPKTGPSDAAAAGQERRPSFTKKELNGGTIPAPEQGGAGR